MTQFKVDEQDLHRAVDKGTSGIRARKRGPRRTDQGQGDAVDLGFAPQLSDAFSVGGEVRVCLEARLDGVEGKLDAAQQESQRRVSITVMAVITRASVGQRWSMRRWQRQHAGRMLTRKTEVNIGGGRARLSL